MFSVADGIAKSLCDQAVSTSGSHEMTIPHQTLCLSMIVKNERDVIRRCLDSVRSVIDYWVIVDTGSTDGTQDIVREYLKGMPGDLHERPWKDFAFNRSEALALSRSHADYSLIIDADDTLEIPKGFQLPTLTADSYVLTIQDRAIRYQRSQLVRNTLGWRYKGVLHEFLTCEGAGPPAHLPIIMHRNHDGARRRNPDTYRRDAAILERACAAETDPFMIARYTFYLAQSYRDHGAQEEALAAYLKRAELGYWDQEVFVSLYKAGQLMEALGRDAETVLATYARASAACRARAEAAHAASRLCRLLGRFAQGCDLAEPVLAVPAPLGGLFVESWIYEYGLRDEFAVNAYWAGRHRDCLDVCLTLLAQETLPEGYRDRIAANARFALERLNEPSAQPERTTAWPTSGGLLLATSTTAGRAPDRPLGGTELMLEGVRERMGRALDSVQLCVNFYDEGQLDGRPLVLWIQHDVDQQAVQWLRDRARADRVDRFVFVSEWQQTRFIRAFGLPAERCTVLRNATDVPTSNRLWTGRRPLRLAYTSTPFRGLSVLLDAWDRLRPEEAELHIWSSHRLYGPAFDDLPYQALFIQAQSLPNVHFHGIVPNPELRAALADIDMLVYPNIFPETSCLAVIEAVAAGCRVICPDLGALPEAVGKFGRIYPFEADPQRHAEIFADLLGKEIANPWGGETSLITAQQTFSRQTYDWPVRVAEWRRFLEDTGERRKALRSSAGLAIAPRSSVFDALARLRERGFNPAGIVDVGAHQGEFARRARAVFPDAHILMVDALAEMEPVLEQVSRDIGNATHAIALLSDEGTEATSFFVVDTV